MIMDTLGDSCLDSLALFTYCKFENWFDFPAIYVFNTVLAPVFGVPNNLEAAARAEKIMIASLARLESFWLKESGPFLLGNSQPSIADICLVCEIMQLEVLYYTIVDFEFEFEFE